MYALPTNGSANYEAVALNSDMAISSGFYADGKYYAVEIMEFFGYTFVNNVVFDAETWETISSNEFNGKVTTFASDFAYDETTGKAYGTFYNADMSGNFIGAFDPATTTTTQKCASDN